MWAGKTTLSLLICFLLALSSHRSSSYVNEWNRIVECYSLRLLGLLRPWGMKLSSNCIIVQFIRSLIQQLLSILLPHHLHFFPLALRTHRLHVWHSLGPLGCGWVTYLMAWLQAINRLTAESVPLPISSFSSPESRGLTWITLNVE